MAVEPSAPPFVAVLAQQRDLVARRAAAVLTSLEASTPEHSAELQQLLGLLSAALEELKVVEEEILRQHEEFAAAAAETNRHATYLRSLFRFAPVALLVTDAAGMIHEANAACASLLHRPVDRLIGKPLTTLVPRDGRREFRTGLVRLSLTTAAHDWPLELLRAADAPMRVTASAQVLPALDDGRPGIIWTLRRPSEVTLATELPHIGMDARERGIPAG